MTPPWKTIAIRAASVALLIAGLAVGVHLGGTGSAARGATQAMDLVQVDLSEQELLKQRQSATAAARAWQRQAKGDAAVKAEAEAKATATKARHLEAKVKAEAARRKARKNGGPVPYLGRIPSSCTEYTGSRAIGCTLMLNAGFPINQFPCLDKLWKKESGWNYRAANTGSGAYGIPQALPGSKMSSAGADWKTNPATQISWGLSYIKGRYKTPCGAWTTSENTGSY